MVQVTFLNLTSMKAGFGAVPVAAFCMEYNAQDWFSVAFGGQVISRSSEERLEHFRVTAVRGISE